MVGFVALFMMMTRYSNGGKAVEEFKVKAPPPMNTMEQLLAVQNAISQAEEVIQDGNVALRKLRGLFLSIYPQVIIQVIIHPIGTVSVVIEIKR